MYREAFSERARTRAQVPQPDAGGRFLLCTGQRHFHPQAQLLFADIIITIPMLILFLIFNKRIVAGMVAGAVKG